MAYLTVAYTSPLLHCCGLHLTFTVYSSFKCITPHKLIVIFNILNTNEFKLTFDTSSSRKRYHYPFLVVGMKNDESLVKIERNLCLADKLPLPEFPIARNRVEIRPPMRGPGGVKMHIRR